MQAQVLGCMGVGVNLRVYEPENPKICRKACDMHGDWGLWVTQVGGPGEGCALQVVPVGGQEADGERDAADEQVLDVDLGLLQVLQAVAAAQDLQVGPILLPAECEQPR